MTTASKPEHALTRTDGAPAAEKPRTALTVKEKKAFLEVASRSDLDKLSESERHGALIAFGQHTGLRAELGEVLIYQGRFYVTMLGRVRNAHASGLLDGMDARPVSAIEKVAAGYESGDLVWKCKVYRKGSSFPFIGWGKVTAEEIQKARAGEKSRYTPIAKHPVEMARKRAEYDGLRLAFPLDEMVTERSAQFIPAAEAEMAEARTRRALVQEAELLEDEAAGREVTDQLAVGASTEPDLYQDALAVVKGATPDARRRLIQKDALQANLGGEDLDAIILRVTRKTKLPDIIEDAELVAKVLVEIANVAAASGQ